MTEGQSQLELEATGREDRGATVDRRAGDPGAIRAYLGNLVSVPRTLRESLIRHGAPTSDRARSQTVLGNFFLHMLSARVHLNSLKFAATMGLGVITLV